MKRKIIFFAMATVLAGSFLLQGCKKEQGPGFVEHWSFTEPAAVAPENGTTVHITGTTVDLQWASTSASGDAPKADVRFGTSEEPGLFAANVSGLSLTVTVEKGLTYYWQVVMKDVNGVTVTSPVFSFTVFEPIGIFVGDFLADEPAENYTYDISFSKKSDNILQTENYWNSGWHAEFTMDFVANTYSMPLTVWGTYSAVESGTIDPATGTMVGTYTIYNPVVPTPIAIETGVHTYTKK